MYKLSITCYFELSFGVFSLFVSPAYYVHISFPLNLHFLCSAPYCFRRLFLHGISVRGLRTSAADFAWKENQVNKKNRWTEEWLARFRRRSSTEKTSVLVLQDAPVPARARLLELCRRNKWHNTRIDKHRFPGVGTIGEQSVVLLRVLCVRIAPKLHSGCKNAEGCLGKS